MNDLLVAGAGPAGLATAIHAARAGLSVTVVDRRPGPIDKACGEGLMPHTLRHLDALGITPHGKPFRGITYLDRNRRVEARFPGAAGRGVRRTVLSEALHDTAATAGVRIVKGNIGDIELDANGVRCGGFAARYLAAADGLHSLIRRQVGLLFQDPDDQLFCPTVYEDVAFGPKQLGLDPAEIVPRVLAEVGLVGFESRSPSRMSHGEKRRACLAGVLACDPAILVLDEPSSDLDPRGRRELIALLRRLPITKIIASHDLELVVELCSRVLVLDRGKIVADGPTTEILNDEPLMLAHGLERPHILRHSHPH